MGYDRAKQSAYSLAWARANPERTKEIKRKYYESHREKVYLYAKEYRARKREQIEAQKRAWTKANPELVAIESVRRRLKRDESKSGLARYRVTLAEYRAILESQEGRCAICRGTEANSRCHRFFVDHDHDTGMLRGLLCNRCNSAMGYFRENPELLRRAAIYLEAFGGSTCVNWLGRVQSVLEQLPEASSEDRRDQGMESDQADAATA